MGSILKVYKESEGIPWPPTAVDIELSVENILPEDLIRFPSLLIAGKGENETSEKVMQLISSIAQDPCCAVSDGTWKLPKYILLCMTIRHFDAKN